MSNASQVLVVEVRPEPHGNADSLSVVKVYDYTCVIRTADWVGINKAAWIPPDSLVPVNNETFAFLAADANKSGLARIKAKRLRGVLSFGLLVPVDPSLEVGADVTELLGVTHYEPPIEGEGACGNSFGGEASSGPNVIAPKYDIESARKYAKAMFEVGEPVLISEKVHGANGRYVFSGGQQFCGSRTEWKREYPSGDGLDFETLSAKVGQERATSIIESFKNKPKVQNLWWKCLAQTSSLREFCEAFPDHVVYGEVFGAVQDLRYGCAPGEVKFAAFDVMKDGRFLDAAIARKMLNDFNVPQVPLLNDVVCGEIDPIPFDFDAICEMSEGQSLVPGANHVREGVVVKPWTERYDPRLGRAIVKSVGCGYYDRKQKAPKMSASA